jgi:hypothetical protein
MVYMRFLPSGIRKERTELTEFLEETIKRTRKNAIWSLFPRSPIPVGLLCLGILWWRHALFSILGGLCLVFIVIGFIRTVAHKKRLKRRREISAVRNFPDFYHDD